jgi:hypothetical protein
MIGSQDEEGGLNKLKANYMISFLRTNSSFCSS